MMQVPMTQPDSTQTEKKKFHPERRPGETVVLVRHNGPYRVYGPARLVDAEGNEYEVPPGDWFVLCRCGASGTKPFCDSTHKRVGFDAPAVAPARAPAD
jgi:CDGSH-type Zn-finger protein